MSDNGNSVKKFSFERNNNEEYENQSLFVNADLTNKRENFISSKIKNETNLDYVRVNLINRLQFK